MLKKDKSTTIKRLRVRDIKAVQAFWASVASFEFSPRGRDSAAMLRREIMRHGCAFFGLFANGKLAGTAIAQYDGRRGWINHLAVAGNCRRKGFGAQLIASCENYLNSFGEVVICALIRKGNVASEFCFEKSGFNRSDEIRYWSKRKRPDL